MSYECNDIIFCATENLPVIFWKSVWEHFLPKNHVPAHRRARHVQEQTLHHLLLGFPWCLWTIKPSNLLSLLTTKAEIALTSSLQPQSSQLFGVNKGGERGNPPAGIFLAKDAAFTGAITSRTETRLALTGYKSHSSDHKAASLLPVSHFCNQDSKN